MTWYPLFAGCQNNDYAMIAKGDTIVISTHERNVILGLWSTIFGPASVYDQVCEYAWV